MVPHAPLLLPEVARANAAATSIVRAAVGTLVFEGPVVIASPHGRRAGVYKRVSGDLDAFGPHDVSASAPPDEDFARDLAEAWRMPLLDEPADHGIVVPLRLLPAAPAVVAVAFKDEGAGDGAALARALLSVGRSFSFVASANLSAGLTERAPVPSIEGAAEADVAALSALRDSPEALAGLGPDLTAAGSCGAPVLAAFGTLFAGRSGDVLAYEHPFGVGYAVAVTR